tara:strand:+ start:145 stop:861 length:717 start_codon:yes stop_codon:yes gene_type:complete
MNTRLSVNVNKLATLRNARGANNPDIIDLVTKIESYGANGITIHPRPDERHITLKDVYDISEIVKTDFNIEGYPDERFMEIINDIRPEQVTLVPDSPDVITSNRGWLESDLNIDLKSIVSTIKDLGPKVSLFIDPTTSMVDLALNCGVDRIELYTGVYAKNFKKNKLSAVDDCVTASQYAKNKGLDVNAGHDLDLNNLNYLKENIPFLYEVSIGHALICDSLIYGLEDTIRKYLLQIS